MDTKTTKKMTFAEWFEILQGFVKAGNCLTDDGFSIRKITNVSIENNSSGQPAGIVFDCESAE
jgi:hypothetical protein